MLNVQNSSVELLATWMRFQYLYFRLCYLFWADKKISSPSRSTPLRNSAGQDSSSSVLLSSSVKFLSAICIWLRCNDMQLPVLFNVSFPFIWVEVCQICLLTAISLPCNYSQVRTSKITNISISPQHLYCVN